MTGEARIFWLSESASWARQVAAQAGIVAGALEERNFEGGEFKLRPLESVRARPVYLAQSLAGSSAASPAERLVRLLFLLYGLRDAGAAPCTVLIPYLAWARKDRRTQPRDPVNTRYVAQLLEAAGAQRVVTLDAHNPAALDNAFRIPVDHLSALPMMVDDLARRLGGADLSVASPDVGGIKRAQILREQLAARLGREVELIFIEKRRSGGVLTHGDSIGEVAGRTVIVVDDLCATGTTLVHAARTLALAGAAAVHVAITHAPLAAGLAAVLAAAEIASVLVTDSTGSLPGPAADGRLVTLSSAALFGAALQRMAEGRPVAPLLEHWPVGEIP